jgi:hypothetical protein
VFKKNIAAQPKTQIKSISYVALHLTSKYSGFLFGFFVSALLIQLSKISGKKIEILEFLEFLVFF